jgi:hypothetical protein
MGRGAGRIGSHSGMRVGQCAVIVDWRQELFVLLRRVSRRRASVMRFMSCVLFRARPREALGPFHKVGKRAGRCSDYSVSCGDGAARWPWEGGCAEVGKGAPLRGRARMVKRGGGGVGTRGAGAGTDSLHGCQSLPGGSAVAAAMLMVC